MGRARIARREYASLRREKTILLALGIQLFIAAFSSFLLVGLVSLYDPGAVSANDINIGVSGDARADLIDAIEGEGSWELVAYESEAAARTAFKQGRVDTVFLADRLPTGVVYVSAIVPDESVRSTVIVVQVREALQVYERTRREAFASRLTDKPVPVPKAPDSTPTFSFTYTVLLPLLAFLPTFISGSVAADAITEEFDQDTLDLLRVTPLSFAEILDGKMLAMIALAPAQAGVWMLLLWLNGTTMANPLAILAIVTGAATVLVAIGTGLAVRMRDRQSTQLLYSLTVLLVFVLGTLVPESPPNLVAKFAMGSASQLSMGLVVAYLSAGVVAYIVVRRDARRTIRG